MDLGGNETEWKKPGTSVPYDNVLHQNINNIYEGCLKSSWTGGSTPLLCCYASHCITAAHCRQFTNFSNGLRIRS
jgi:hypothetical protein